MNKDIKDIIILLTALLLSAIVIAGIYYRAKRIPEETPGTLKRYQLQGTPDHPAMFYPTDLTKDINLLGSSHDVFIGKVISQTGDKETQIGPRTQYSVEVIDNIKGKLKDIVTIDMLGGYDKDGKLVVIEENDSTDFLLKPGSTYLFATRYNEEEDWYTLISHPNARKIISTDNTKNEAALMALIDQDEKVKSFESAYAHEVLLDADIAHGNTRNSFQSLAPAEKAAAQSRADAARALLEAMQ
ncbi:MAG: hypothetical protein A2845_00775 [Candidatus Lloydbacteria bacterium RIFCSPHIGHO2_01_FULL_49_22]|uniref:Uncharacterized protein n=1 Tax=Candidatus Lloydbacteria bacterium RIFCSPHIGHO2_01_FULL_49_22 TaxID=1798658 RepID=A0A1G2CY57_9BACT|nr:MAG: hypothetical protein A2845_00775 [Candidatus Lloydbacteria bacterium RIFCSPHIGHO2_01_FULL_49_22]OGZ09390.1 MAG: hypothetical protein A3C14_05680 [Candidatus Lloydbacteria bacterium RIFCSPHIGHO2_02_FULL_50_18]